MGQNLTTLILMVGQIVNHKKAIAMAIMNGDGEVYEEYKASLAAFERDLDFESVLEHLNKLDSATQPAPTFIRGQEAEQMKALIADGRPLLCSPEYLAMLHDDATTMRDLRDLPAGYYALRKKYSLGDSWDAMILTDSAVQSLGDHGVTECAYSVHLHEAAPALLRDAREKQQR